jgi:NADH-quinone oxidoreductase subunit M
MILLWLILTPLIGGLLAGFSGRRNGGLPRWLSLGCLAIDLALVLVLCATHYSAAVTLNGTWLAQIDWPWIPQLGIRLHLGLDGLSLLLILLTIGLGVMSVVASWSEITERVGFFHFNLMLTLAGVIGVFLALDLFLFFFFWELMLVPMYFLIAVWGHERRIYAAIKFFLFTQGSGLLMFAAIVALALINYRQTGTLTFDYFVLAKTQLGSTTQMWLMLGFFIAFAVKLPVVPFHTWLADAHTEAPTAGSVILAGLLLKTSAYGLLRFAVPLFPAASATFAPVAMTLGVIGILYGAMLAFAQDDMKRLVAYTSISHLGFACSASMPGTPWRCRARSSRCWRTASAPAPCSFWSARFRSGSIPVTCGNWAACGRPHRASAQLACSSQSLLSGYPDSAILSANSWFCSAPTASPAGLRSRGRWDWWSPPSMPLASSSVSSKASAQRAQPSPTSRRVTCSSWRR